MHRVHPSADAIIADVEDRLRVLAAHRPFRFRNTARKDAERYLQHTVAFEGFVPPDVAAWEHSLGLTFPDVFRAFMLRLGRRPGELFANAHLWPRTLEVTQWARELLLQNPALQLGPMDLPFLMQRGHTIFYLTCAGGLDNPVHRYTEFDGAPQLAAPGFAQFLDHELQTLERNHVAAHARGGYLLTVHPNGGTTMHFPAADAGFRPLDTDDDFLD